MGSKHIFDIDIHIYGLLDVDHLFHNFSSFSL